MTTNHGSRLTHWLRLLLLPLMLSALAACAENFNAKVTRFQSQLPPPAGQSFAIVAEDPALAGGIEFGQYSRLVAAQLLKAGYTEATSPQAASLIVHFDYGVDKGREHVRESAFARDPFWGPWYGWRPGGYWGHGFYGPGFYRHGYWGFGWYDPWFDNGLESYTVYTSGVSLKIDDKTGRRLFEGKAEAASTSNKLSYLVPNLVEAMFTGFPGNSGETVRITIAPEKQAVKKP
ncbi:MAG: DUF4136 domain-containing protein [Sphingomonadales bacterium]|nr:DUF4136 domain-containing protein [Sphingomonadales bacterium]